MEELLSNHPIGDDDHDGGDDEDRDGDAPDPGGGEEGQGAGGEVGDIRVVPGGHQGQRLEETQQPAGEDGQGCNCLPRLQVLLEEVAVVVHDKPGNVE